MRATMALTVLVVACGSSPSWKAKQEQVQLAASLESINTDTWARRLTVSPTCAAGQTTPCGLVASKLDDPAWEARFAREHCGIDLSEQRMTADCLTLIADSFSATIVRRYSYADFPGIVAACQRLGERCERGSFEMTLLESHNRAVLATAQARQVAIREQRAADLERIERQQAEHERATAASALAGVALIFRGIGEAVSPPAAKTPVQCCDGQFILCGTDESRQGCCHLRGGVMGGERCPLAGPPVR